MGSQEQPFRVRQLWAHTTVATPTGRPDCTPLTLPKNGVISLDSELAVTLTAPAVFFPECTGASFLQQICNDNSVSDPREPFYASTSPQIYALASCTVIAYLLAIMLFITPRTFFVGGQGGGARFLGTRGIMGASFGNPSIVSVGRRPWLQKLAALSVAASLTIASADTFRIAERQYDDGFTDSSNLVNEVAASLEIRIVRVISTTFLWLAQVQTLIRLFPRHKEKVVIKWLGFALIVLDTVFSILNNFVHSGSRTKPRSFQDAIPALSYLFELSISFIYASCVIYYALSKRRFAFFHLKMRNMFLVAIMALTAVLIPIVFFVLDVSKPNVAGWGDYVRWVGSAAASVVVWEWVERIEALERDERKDGILGREIFDGDDMLEVTPSEEIDWPGRGDDSEKGESKAMASGWTDRNRRRAIRSRLRAQATNGLSRHAPFISRLLPHTTGPTPPPPAVTPVSRADTQSATSTVYAVRYHPVATPSVSGPATIPEINLPEDNSPLAVKVEKSPLEISSQAQEHHSTGANNKVGTSLLTNSAAQAQQMWRSMPNPFKRRRGSPPAEVAGAQRAKLRATNSQASLRSTGSIKGKSVRERVDRFKETQKAKNQEKTKGRNIKANLPVTIIPARSKGQRTWSPEDLDLGNAAIGTDTSGNVVLQQATRRDHSQEPVVTLTPAPRREDIGIAHSSPPETAASETLLGSNDEQSIPGAPTSPEDVIRSNSTPSATRQPTDEAETSFQNRLITSSKGLLTGSENERAMNMIEESDGDASHAVPESVGRRNDSNSDPGISISESRSPESGETSESAFMDILNQASDKEPPDQGDDPPSAATHSIEHTQNASIPSSEDLRS